MKNIQGDQVALFLSGQDVPIPECNIIIHQPTIKQIVMFKESNFLTAINLFGKIHENAERVRNSNEQANQFNDFQILMALINQDKNMQQSADSLFKLIFPQYIVEIDENTISFYQEERRFGMIDLYNYEAFENIINSLFAIPDKGNSYNPANDKAKELAKKFKERADILAKQKKENINSVSLYGTYVSVLSVGMNIDINILFNYTPFQLYNIFDRYWKKVNSDFYQRVSTMPMMDTSKMEEPDA